MKQEIEINEIIAMKLMSEELHELSDKVAETRRDLRMLEIEVLVVKRMLCLVILLLGLLNLFIIIWSVK